MGGEDKTLQQLLEESFDRVHVQLVVGQQRQKEIYDRHVHAW